MAPALRRSSGTLGRGDSTRGAVSAIGAVSANRTVLDATRIVKKLTFFLSSNSMLSMWQIMRIEACDRQRICD